MSLFISAATTKGILREENQDVIYAGDKIVSDEGNYTKNFDEDMITLAIADGMGGHLNGRFAADTAIKNIHRNKNNKSNHDIITEINDELGAINNGKNIRECMGTTLCIIKIKNETMYWSSVGDSSIYIMNKDFIQRVNNLDEVLDRYGTRTGVIDNCLGASYKVQPIKIHSGKETLKKDFYCLSLSDGVSGFLTDNEIHELVISEEINKVCNKILEKSMEAKSTDNISIIMAKYKN